MQTDTPKRILVIEDQELNRKVVRIVLQSKGYTVVEATDAVEAIASLEDAIPQLILMGYRITRTKWRRVSREN